MASLPYSNYTYVEAIPSQRSEDFLSALASCLKHLGGSPRVLVPDNFKAAVMKTDKYEPKINQLLEDFSNHYHIAVVPARVQRPKDKASVENSVRLIYQRVYAKLRNREFYSLEALNKAIREKVMEHNQTRMQQYDVSRQEKFLAKEQPLLRPLPTEPFEVKYTAELTVTPDCFIYLGRDQHYYSVPYQNIGSRVIVVYTKSLVKIYRKGECIATHSRSTTKNGRTFIESHFGSRNGVYSKVNPTALIQEASAKSAVLGRLFEKYFQSERAPELAYKKCRGILQLRKESDPSVFEQACQIACENNLLGYKRFKSILSFCAAQQADQEDWPLPPEHENIRGKTYYK